MGRGGEDVWNWERYDMLMSTFSSSVLRKQPQVPKSRHR
jgi:hypothetical protein